MMNILYSILIAGPIILGISELVNRTVCGPLLKSRDVMPFLVKNKKNAHLNPYDDNIIMGMATMPITIATMCWTAKWYIVECGRIPRWSKASRYLNKIHRELKMAQPSALQRAFPRQKN